MRHPNSIGRPFRKGHKPATAYRKGVKFPREEIERRTKTRLARMVHGPSWKGGRILDNGYYRIYVDGKYILEHRIVAEKKLGRKLLSSEVAHHINENKSDNRPENIEVITRSEHISLHSKGKKRPGAGYNFHRKGNKYGVVSNSDN